MIMIKKLKKNDRLVDIETGAEWVFDCKTRGPDIVTGDKPIVSWTCVLYNRAGERRFVPETKLASLYRLPE